MPCIKFKGFPFRLHALCASTEKIVASEELDDREDVNW